LGLASIDVAAAIAYQQDLRQKVVLEGDLSGLDLIGGVDTSSFPTGLHGRWKMENGTLGIPKSQIPNPKFPLIHAAIVVWSLSRKQVVASATASRPATFPYIPGLLAFREAPSLLEAWSKLNVKPDVIICDGHGIAHPRRCGIACHLGVELAVPAIGCAKSRLTGWFKEPGLSKGDWSEIWSDTPHSKIQNPKSKIGIVIRTRDNVSPVFVSPGHLCDIEGAASLTLRCCLRYRLPEPIRAAHIAAGEALRSTEPR
jgi:deoxyribonuclease V